MRLRRLGDAWVWVGGPVPPGFAAITVGRLISVRARAAADEALLRHELVHVEQYRRLGIVGFLRRYLAAYLSGRLRRLGHLGAYRRIPQEVEAVWRTTLGTIASPASNTPPRSTDGARPPEPDADLA